METVGPQDFQKTFHRAANLRLRVWISELKLGGSHELPGVWRFRNPGNGNLANELRVGSKELDGDVLAVRLCVDSNVTIASTRIKHRDGLTDF